jgi:hypothetical protein
MVDTGSGVLCRLIVAVFGLDRADHADFRVSSAVVDAFDPVANCEPSSDLRGPGPPVVLYGWKLFEPNLVHDPGLQDLSADQLNDLVRESVLKVIKS